MLPIIFALPIVQLLLLSYAATYEMKNIKMSVSDLDKSSLSRSLTGKFKGSSFYSIVNYSDAYKVAENDLKVGNADMVLQIPEHFERDLMREDKAKLQITINQNYMCIPIMQSQCQIDCNGCTTRSTFGAVDRNNFSL